MYNKLLSLSTLIFRIFTICLVLISCGKKSYQKIYERAKQKRGTWKLFMNISLRDSNDIEFNSYRDTLLLEFMENGNGIAHKHGTPNSAITFTWEVGKDGGALYDRKAYLRTKYLPLSRNNDLFCITQATKSYEAWESIESGFLWMAIKLSSVVTFIKDNNIFNLP